MKFHKKQQEAIDRALAEKKLIITGPAGTGKTQVAKEIVDLIGEKKCDVLSFTGKACARLREIGVKARTIHSWLKHDGNTPQRTEKAVNTVIIDEASMVESSLLYNIMKFNPPKIILIGDPYQLPPVGKGQPFHDLIANRPEICSHLTKCFRNKAAIHMSANIIRDGNMPPFHSESEGEKYVFINQSNAEKAHDMILAWVKKEHAAKTFDQRNDIILTPVNGRSDAEACGNRRLNNDIAQIVNPRQEGEKWKVGDRINCRKNFSDLDFFNGDFGTIIGINGDILIVERDRGGNVQITKDMHKSIDLGYSLTIHRSQGSQWKRVLILALDTHRMLLTRPLIYTAVTRASEACCIIGSNAAFRDALNNKQDKKTVMQWLYKNEAKS